MTTQLRLILGTMELGRRSLTEDGPCHSIIQMFRSRGYNELDTALMYCGGESERILGRMAGCQGSTKLSVATKANPWGEGGLKPEKVMQQLEQSLKNLQLPSVDLFYLHAPDHSTPVEETLRAVQDLYIAGKFKEFGLSNYAAWEVAEIYHICKSNGWILPTVYQGMYNGICRMVEQELFPCLRHYGIRFYAYNPLAGGILSGKFSFDDLTKPDANHDGRYFVKSAWVKTYQDRFWRKPVFEGVDLIQKALNDAYGVGKVSMVSAAFQWLCHHSKLSPEHHDGVILGVSSEEHLKANITAFEKGPLEPAVVAMFDEAWKLDKANCAQYFR